MRTSLASQLVLVALLACIAAGPCLARVPNRDRSAGMLAPGVNPAVVRGSVDPPTAAAGAADPRQASISINDGDVSVDVNVPDNTGNDGNNTDSINLSDIFDSINDVFDTALNIAEDIDYNAGDWMQPYYGLAKGIAEVTKDNSIHPYKSEEDIPLSFYFKKLWEAKVHHIASLIAENEPEDDSSDDKCDCQDDNCDNCNKCDCDDDNCDNCNDNNDDCDCDDDDNCDCNRKNKNTINNNVAVNVVVRKDGNTTVTDDGTDGSADDDTGSA